MRCTCACVCGYHKYFGKIPDIFACFPELTTSLHKKYFEEIPEILSGGYASSFTQSIAFHKNISDIYPIVFTYNFEFSMWCACSTSVCEEWGKLHVTEQVWENRTIQGIAMQSLPAVAAHRFVSSMLVNFLKASVYLQHQGIF